MYTLGADGLAPQIGSALLLMAFYLTDFQIVSYIPKPAFSSMLVLSFFDMIHTWFYKSFFKTKDATEWMVVPVSDATYIGTRSTCYIVYFMALETHIPGFVRNFYFYFEKVIVVCAFVLDLLSAVFLGIAFSTFIFVRAFFRSGVVKFAANGQTINSTIERPLRMSQWLNENGDRIQVCACRTICSSGTPRPFTAMYLECSSRTRKRRASS